MVSSNFQRQQAGGYEYLDDHHAIQRSTGEVVEANWAHLPVGTIAYTPEQQEIYREKKEAEQRKAIMRHTNTQLGSFLFADAAHRYADVSPQTMARLIYISTFLPYGERELKGRKNAPMTKGDVKRATKLSEATFFRFWNEVSGKYLFEDSNSHIYVSDNFKRGKLPKSTDHMIAAFWEWNNRRDSLIDRYKSNPDGFRDWGHKAKGITLQDVPELINLFMGDVIKTNH